MKILSVLFVLFSLNVFASEKPSVKSIDLAAARADGGDTYRGSDFRFNEELGTAWIAVNLDDYSGSETSTFETDPLKTRKLIYDAKARHIVYADADSRTVCAVVKKNWYGTTIKKTGECKIRVEFVERRENDGRRFYDRRYMVVSLDVQIAR